MTSVFCRFKRTAAAVMTTVLTAVVPAQEPSQAQVEVFAARLLEAMTANDAQLDLVVSAAYGADLAPAKRAAAKSAMRALAGNDRLPAYLAGILAPVLSPTLTVKEGQAYILEGMVALQVRGLRRLPTNRQAQFLRYTLEMAKAVPASVCKAMFLGKLETRASAVIERRHMASLSLGEFEAATGLYLESAEAELAGYPDVKSINAMQARAAERAFEQAMNTRIRRLPPGLNDRVLDNIEAAEPTEACLWFRETTAAALDLPEPYRAWYLTRFTEGL